MTNTWTHQNLAGASDQWTPAEQIEILARTCRERDQEIIALKAALLRAYEDNITIARCNQALSDFAKPNLTSDPVHAAIATMQAKGLP